MILPHPQLPFTPLTSRECEQNCPYFATLVVFLPRGHKEEEEEGGEGGRGEGGGGGERGGRGEDV